MRIPDAERREGIAPRACGALVAALLLCALGCLGAPRVLYDGPPRSESEIARLEAANSSQASFYGIDGHRVHGSIFLLEPGDHEVWAHVRVDIREDLMLYTIDLYCGIAVQLAAGRTYRLHPIKEFGKRDSLGSKVTVAARVAAVDGGPPEFRAAFCGNKPRLPR